MMPSESMAAIVISEKRTCHRVCHHIITILGNDSPMTRPEITAASRIPEPVAESQFKPNTAPSAVGFDTTGGTRCTNLLRPVTGICGFVILLGTIGHEFVDGNTFSGVFMIFFPL